MKNSNVKVTAKDGMVVIPSVEKPEFGFIRVESESVSMENGWAQITTRSALIRGKVEQLRKLNMKAGDPIAGKIYIKESTTRTHDKQEPKINPQTKEILTSGGYPIYRESYFTADVDKQDELLEMDPQQLLGTVPTETSEVAKEVSKAL